MRWTALRTALLLVILPVAAAGAWALDQRGEFELTLTLTDLLGAERAAALAPVQAPDAPITWSVFVPEEYDPNRPAGLLVYIPATPAGAVPDRWKRVLAEKNLIWVGANRSGNTVHVQRRALFALMGVRVIESRFAVDTNRIYLTGLSGGGKMASMVATDHPHLFRGAIYNSGVEFWDRKPANFEAVRSNRYVFIAGEFDQALRPTRRAFNRYRRAGVEGVRLMVIDGMGHEHVDPNHLAEAIDFLDARGNGPAEQ